MFHGLRKGQDPSVCLPSERGGAAAAALEQRREKMIDKNDIKQRKSGRIERGRLPVEEWRDKREGWKEEWGAGGVGGVTAGCFGLSDG